MTAHARVLVPDEATIRQFIEIIHTAADLAFDGVERPGYLQLVRIHPASEDTVAQRFRIGDVDGMVRAALQDARNGHNVYIEGRTVSETSTGRGKLADTRGVFALVIDSDADKGRAAHVQALPSLAVETSPGNAHYWHFLERAIPAEEARGLGAAMRKATGADDDTGVITQPYRVAGTPNYPGPKKQERGRVATLTRITQHLGTRWTAEDLRDVFPAEQRKAGSSTGSSGRSSIEVTMLVSEIATTTMDRSARFQSAVNAAKRAGMTPDDLEALMRQHPQGCAGKYLDDWDRLREEIDRSWSKEDRWQTGGEERVRRDQDDKAETGSWSEPDLSVLNDGRGTLPEFPVDTMPALSDWLTRSAEGAGATPAHVAVPLLSIASSLIGTARRVRASRSWSEPMTLWSGVVGYSGTAKTPGLNVTTKVLSYIERERRSLIADMRRKHEARVEAAKAANKKWKAEVQDPVDAGRLAPDMPVEAVDPGPFVEPRLFVSDSTVERLAVLLQGRPRGLSLVGDELAGLFMNMGRYSGGSDREFWLTAWNGGSFVVERQGRPPVVLDHLLVGVTGGLQPDKLVKCSEGDQDGMYARLLIGWPEEPGYQPLSDDADEQEPEFLNAMFRLVNLPAEDEDGDFVPKAIKLSPEAVREFEQFREFLHVHKSAYEGGEREWMAKGPGQVLRLAGTLAYLDWAMRGGEEPDEIEIEFMASAVQLWREYFLPHSRAALRLIGLSDRHVDARKVLRWIKAQNKQEVSVKDIRRDALAHRLDADQTNSLISNLVEAGWLRGITVAHSGPGRPARRWSVNPQLFQ